MNPLKVFCLVACLVAVASASPSSKGMAGKPGFANQKLKPTDWLSAAQLEQIPAVDQVTLDSLETMPVADGARMIRKLYHLATMNHDLIPSFVPSPSSINAYIVKQDGAKVPATLNTLSESAKQVPNFGEEEVTVFITGTPQTSPAVQKANDALIEAYVQRYNGGKPQPKANSYSKKPKRSSSEEDYSESWKQDSQPSGNLIVLDLGSTLNTFSRLSMLDIEETGKMVGKALAKLSATNNVPHEIMNVVAQGIAAHVAGAAGNQFTRLTGQKLRRITALDPSRIYARKENSLNGLARGDADFVDAIHTSAYGMGTPIRAGDVDFYPGGPSDGVAGSTNVVEASMRATRYYAETVRPGNERNFPAVPADSIEEYKNNEGLGKRAYMGVATNYDVRGDYMLEVNPKSPFGQSAPAKKQALFHASAKKDWDFE